MPMADEPLSEGEEDARLAAAAAAAAAGCCCWLLEDDEDDEDDLADDDKLDLGTAVLVFRFLDEEDGVFSFLSEETDLFRLDDDFEDEVGVDLLTLVIEIEGGRLEARIWVLITVGGTGADEGVETDDDDDDFFFEEVGIVIGCEKRSASGVMGGMARFLGGLGVVEAGGVGAAIFNFATCGVDDAVDDDGEEGCGVAILSEVTTGVLSIFEILIFVSDLEGDGGLGGLS